MSVEVALHRAFFCWFEEQSSLSQSCWNAADPSLRTILGGWDTWFRIARQFVLAAGLRPHLTLYRLLPTMEAAQRVALSCEHTVALNQRISGRTIGPLDDDELGLCEASFLAERHSLDATIRVLCNMFEISSEL